MSLFLAACAAGVFLALAYLTADYIIVPAVRLRRAIRRGPDDAREHLERERRRIALIENTKAVQEEHGYPDAETLRDKVRIRRLTLRRMERSIRAAHTGDGADETKP